MSSNDEMKLRESGDKVRDAAQQEFLHRLADERKALSVAREVVASRHCLHCQYYHQKRKDVATAFYQGNGECRRRAPVTRECDPCVWPLVHDRDTCGEFVFKGWLV